MSCRSFSSQGVLLQRIPFAFTLAPSESELKLPLAMVALASHPSSLLQERKLLRWKVEKRQEGSIIYVFDAILV